MDFYNRRAQAEAALSAWLDSGALKAPVDIVEGFEEEHRARWPECSQATTAASLPWSGV